MRLAITPLSKIMATVCFALVPGITALTYVWGWGVVWNVSFSIAFCLVVEAIALSLRGMPVGASLWDGSAVLTAILIAICLPPHMPLPVIFTAALVAIGLAKHAYGGLGRNIFNPAMVGFAVVLVSFPVDLGQWPSLTIPAALKVDALSGATLLTEFRYRTGLTTDEFLTFHPDTYANQKIIAAAFCIGGIALIWRKVIHWRMPMAVCIGVGIGALFGYDQGASTSTGGWYFHLVAGGTMASAFFIATDPVTLAEKPSHQWLSGVLIGLLIYIIRAFGAYPDGIAFAILLANCLTPLLDRLARTVLPGKHEAQAHDD